MLQSLKISLKFLQNQPEFKKHPAYVLYRIFLWELFKIINHKSKIKIHKKYRMQLIPKKRRGIVGFLFIFHEEYEPVTPLL